VRAWINSAPDLKEGKLEELIEAKYAGEEVSKSHLYYVNRLKPKRATQIVAKIRRSYDKSGVGVTDPCSYFNPDFFQDAF